MNDKDEMSIIFPEREVVLSQETITISPFPFGKWPKIIALATGIVGIAIEEYQKHGEALFDISLDNDRFKISPEIVNFVIRLFSEGGDDLLDILAIGANKPRSWVEALPGDDGMTLLIHVMQVNRDFFFRAGPPQISNADGGTRDNDIGWGQIIATLLHNGHRMREIELYTKDQLIFYYDAAKEQEIERRTDFIYAVRAAVYLDGSTLNRMMEEQTKK